MKNNAFVAEIFLLRGDDLYYFTQNFQHLRGANLSRTTEGRDFFQQWEGVFFSQKAISSVINRYPSPLPPSLLQPLSLTSTLSLHSSSPHTLSHTLPSHTLSLHSPTLSQRTPSPSPSHSLLSSHTLLTHPPHSPTPFIPAHPHTSAGEFSGVS